MKYIAVYKFPGHQDGLIRAMAYGRVFPDKCKEFTNPDAHDSRQFNGINKYSKIRGNSDKPANGQTADIKIRS